MSDLENPHSEGVHQIKSIERLNSYPAISDSITFALGYYRWIKSKNSILDSSLSRIESTLKTVKDRTDFTAGDKIKFIDDTVCKQLDRLEKMCPVILEPSPPILSSLKKVRQSSVPVLDMTHSVTDIASGTMDSIVSNEQMPDGNTGEELEQVSMYSKVKRLSVRAQRRFYNIAIAEINSVQKISVEKITKLHSIVQEMQGRGTLDSGRVLEGCESNAELSDSTAQSKEPSQVPQRSNITAASPSLVQQALNQIEQLQQIMAAIANIQQYASKDTVKGLVFINTHLSLLKKVLIVNEKLLHQSIIVIDKVQSVIDYVILKIKEYLKSQKITDIDCDSDSE